MSIADLPLLNASLNALSACFIVLGLVFIKRERKLAHTVCMTAAVVTSALFLTSYLTYHIARGGQVTHFTHTGWPKIIYFLILGTHTPLAAIVPPLVIVTVLRAIQARYDSHRRWAQWTAPIWLYVSVTGVLVYLMLYVWFPPALFEAASQ